MINIIINSGYSFFSLRKSLTLYLLKKNEKITIYSPDNINNIKIKIKSNNFNVLGLSLKKNKKSLFSLIRNIYNCYCKFRKKSSDTNVIFGTYMNLIFGIIFFNF